MLLYSNINQHIKDDEFRKRGMRVMGGKNMDISMIQRQ